MPFKGKSGKFKAAIKEVTIGVGDKAVKMGGENVLPFYTFDGGNASAPIVGVYVSDKGVEGQPAAIKAYYEGCATVAEMAKKAAEMPGGDFVVVHFESADPNGDDASVESCMETLKSVVEAVDCPLAVMGSGNDEKDADLLVKAAEVCEGKNVLILSAKEGNYKSIAMSGVQAYHQKVAAESAVDINLAKQLNVLIKQLGVDTGKIVMNVGSAAAGYGFDYCISTLDRVKGAALGQSDDSLLMPIITPVADETWSVKEASASEEDVPEWGSVVDRAIDMEIATAVACLSCGSDAVILKHPTSIATVSAMIKALV